MCREHLPSSNLRGRNLGGYEENESNWQPIQTAMIDSMIRLEKSVSPFIAKLG
jgi:hypothetical protein